MINEKKDACYHKVKARYKVWPSAYASGALVKCRKKGAKNWGNSRTDEALHTAYFNFAVSLLEGMVGPTGKGVSPERVKQATEAAKARKAANATKAGGSASQAGGSLDSNVKKTIKKYQAGKAPTTPQAGIGGKSTSVAAGDQSGGETPERRKGRAGDEEVERLTRATLRGKFKRQKRYVTDPKTGKRVEKRETVSQALGRAARERLGDFALDKAEQQVRGLPGSSLRGLKKGRAKAKSKQQRIDFSHTEYQRIGAILAEGKGVMPKKFSVKSGDKSAAGGLTAKGVKRYRAANPGSKLKTAVTTKPSKLKKGSKAASRRKSFCARMGGMKKRLTSSKTANDPNSRINKALRKWNC